MYDDLTLQFYKDKPLDYRKKNGQYMTSFSIIEKSFSYIDINKYNTILEPSCGTGQFLNILIRNGIIPSKITTVEKDKYLHDIIKNKYKDMNHICGDFLKHKFNNKFDLIVGNPPYFEFIPDDSIKSEYGDVICGRINIYTLFIKKCIDLLRHNGVLVFIIPTSIISSAYFINIRKYIIDNCNIHKIKILNTNDFKDALQQTMIFIIQKLPKNKINNGKYILSKDYIFTPKYNQYNEMIKNMKTIKDLGCTVKTGNIVWNQHKDKLTNDKTKKILIYPRNIVNNKLILSDHTEKKQYIDIDKPTIKCPVIVINRIIGVKDITLKPLLIEKGDYLFENHINIITGPLDKLKIIYNSLINQSTLNYIKDIIGNTQLSKNELENLIPII